MSVERYARKIRARIIAAEPRKFISSGKFESGGHLHQICKRVGPHLLHHLASVRLHGDYADAEFTTDPCLFNGPDDTKAMTCRSRGESEA